VTVRKPATTPPASKRLRNVDTKMCAANDDISVFSTSVHLSARGKADNDESESRIKRGFAIAPVKLNLVEKNRALVGLGSYLVNAVGGCNDCHTNPNYAPGGNPFLDSRSR